MSEENGETQETQTTQETNEALIPEDLETLKAQLEEEKRQGVLESTSVAPAGSDVSNEQAMMRSLNMNPVYQNLRMQLSQADADLAEMRGQIGAQQSVIADLRSRVDAIPEVEAELARLNRDYEVNKKQYDTLLQRLESARARRSGPPAANA